MGSDGYVWVKPDEVRALAELLGMTVHAFGTRYVRRVGARLALVDGPGGDCVFLSAKTCSVYEARPVQCRTYPWWSDNLADPGAWGVAATQCEGIHEAAPLVAADVISDALAGRPPASADETDAEPDSEAAAKRP
jgi:Fe-S-cluster containining protein